jgi:hypothetical protein
MLLQQKKTHGLCRMGFDLCPGLKKVAAWRCRRMSCSGCCGDLIPGEVHIRRGVIADRPAKRVWVALARSVCGLAQRRPDTPSLSNLPGCGNPTMISGAWTQFSHQVSRIKRCMLIFDITFSAFRQALPHIPCSVTALRASRSACRRFSCRDFCLANLQYDQMRQKTHLPLTRPRQWRRLELRPGRAGCESAT